MISLPLTALIALGLTLTPAFADELHMTTGSTVRGVIVEETAESVQMLVAGLSRISVATNLIDSIERSDAATNSLLMGTLHLEQQMMWEAVQHWNLAIQQGLEPSEFANTLAARPASIATLVGNLPEEQAILCKNFLLQTLAGVPTTEDILYLAGRLSQATGDNDRALAAYLQLPEEHHWSHPERRAQISQFLQGRAREEIQNGNLDTVFELLTHLTAVDPALADELRPLFFIRSANQMMRTGQWEEAMLLVNDGVMPIAPQIATVWLESVFTEIEHGSPDEIPTNDAARLFQRFHPLQFENTDEHLARLFLNHGQSHLEAGRHEEARRSFRRHLDYTNDHALGVELIDRSTFLEHAGEIPLDDVTGRIDLIRDMVEAEQWQIALGQLDLLPKIEDNRLQAYIVTQRRSILGNLAQQSWLVAWEHYQAGEYSDCLDVLTREDDLYQRAHLSEETEQLREMCQTRMAEHQTMRNLQALARYQEAERQFFLGFYSEAMPIYDSILRQYPETPAAADAALRLREAHQRLIVRGRPTEEGLRELARTLEQIIEATETSEEKQREELEEILGAVDGESDSM